MPGAKIDAVYDALVDGGPTLVVCRHEQNAEFMAGAIGRLTGNPGVVLVTSGPGTTNLATGLLAAPTDRTPFAAVTRFHGDFEIPVQTRTGRAELTAAIDRQIQSPNLIYAIKITGRFAELHTRTVMAQKRPYPPLTEATEEQAETVFTDVSGTVVGFRTPDFAQGISVAGYHLHFLNEERTAGGHVVDLTLGHGTVAVSGASQLHLSLATSGAFLGAQLSGDDLAERIGKAEGPKGGDSPQR